jgi:hypothetical protein
MSELNGKVVPVDMAAFERNRAAFDPEGFAPFMDQFILWNGDATAILASAVTAEEAYAEAERMGVRADQVVLEFVDAGAGRI